MLFNYFKVAPNTMWLNALFGEYINDETYIDCKILHIS